MGFLEKLKSFKPKEGPEIQELRKVHPDFQDGDPDDDWLFNHHPQVIHPQVKVRFSFDDAQLLDNCSFRAKIGMNLDPAVPGKYIGFAYGRDKDRGALTAWANKFPFAELWEGLQDKGISGPDSRTTRLTN